MPRDMDAAIYQTADYVVTVEAQTDVTLPEERRLSYFVRHKTHRVLFDTTQQLGGAIAACQGLQQYMDELTAREGQPASAYGKAN